MNMGDFECPADTRGEEKLRAVVTGMLRVDCLLLRLQICRVGGGRSPFFFFYFSNIYFADLFGEHGYIFIE